MATTTLMDTKEAPKLCLTLDVEDLLSDWNRMITFDALEYYKPDLSVQNVAYNADVSSSPSASSSSSPCTTSPQPSKTFHTSKVLKYNLDNVQFRSDSPSPSHVSLSSSLNVAGKNLKFHETRFVTKPGGAPPLKLPQVKREIVGIAKTSRRCSRMSPDGNIKFVFHNNIID